MGIGDWGLGVWGWGVWGRPPTPQPQNQKHKTPNTRI